MNLKIPRIIWEGWRKYIKGDTKKGGGDPSSQYDLLHMLSYQL